MGKFDKIIKHVFLKRLSNIYNIRHCINMHRAYVDMLSIIKMQLTFKLIVKVVWITIQHCCLPYFFFFKEISFEARKKSLEEIKKSISQLSPSKRQDVAKQREAVQYVEDLITRCQTHVSQLSTVDKTGNYNLIPP